MPIDDATSKKLPNNYRVLEGGEWSTLTGKLAGSSQPGYGSSRSKDAAILSRLRNKETMEQAGVDKLLIENLQAFYAAGVRTMYSLSSAGSDRNPELVQYLCQNLFDEDTNCVTAIDGVNIEIEDFHAPSADQLSVIADDVTSRLAKGENLVIFCGAGIGRTGTVLAAIDMQVTGEYDVEKSIANVRKAYYGSAVETSSQRLALKQFSQDAKVKKFIDVGLKDGASAEDINKALKFAIELNRGVKVKKLLDKGASFEQAVGTNFADQTKALQFLIKNKMLTEAMNMVKLGANINIRDEDGTSLLELLIKEKELILIEKLCEYPALDLNSKNRNYQSPIEQAKGNDAIVKTLVFKGAALTDITLPTEQIKQYWQDAINTGNFIAIKNLYEFNSLLANSESLQNIFDKGDQKLFLSVVTLGNASSQDIEKAVSILASIDDPKIIEEMIFQGVNFNTLRNQDGNFPLDCQKHFTPEKLKIYLKQAIDDGNFKAINNLNKIDSSIKDLLIDDVLAVDYAVQCKNNDLAIEMVKSGFGIPAIMVTKSNAPLDNALSFAVTLNNSQQYTQNLINSGANAQTVTKSEGKNILIRMIEAGKLEDIKALNLYQLGINQPDLSGSTALMVAVKKGYVELVDTLLSNYVDSNAKDNFGVSATAMAVRMKKPVILGKLLNAWGANLNEITDTGKTIKAEIIESADQNMIKALIPKLNSDELMKTILPPIMDNKEQLEATLSLIKPFTLSIMLSKIDNILLFEKILPYMAKDSLYVDEALEKAIAANNLPMLEKILPYMAKASSYINAAFQEIIGANNLPMLEKILPYIDKDSFYLGDALVKVIEVNNLPMLEKILPYMDKDSYYINAALSMATQENNLPVIKMLSSYKNGLDFLDSKKTAKIEVVEHVIGSSSPVTQADHLKISEHEAADKGPANPTSSNDSKSSEISEKVTRKHNVDSDSMWRLKTRYYSSDINKFNEILTKYNIQASADALRDDSKFRRLILTKLHPDKGGSPEDFSFVQGLKEKLSKDLDIKASLDSVKTVLHQANVGMKVANTVVDAARLVNEPTVENAQKVALGAAHLASMHYGFSGYSAAVGATDVLNKVSQGEYKQAAASAVTSAAYMAAPIIIERLGVPYLDVAYGVAMTAYTGYNMTSNAYSLYQEYGSEESKLRSTKAYSNLAQALSKTPLQRIYDFSSAIDNTTPAIVTSDLHLAASKGETEKVQALISDGVDIDSVDKLGSTPLHVAILRKKFDTVQALVESGANVNAVNNKGLTPLHVAAIFENNDEVIKLLLKAGGKPSEEDRVKYPKYFGEEVITELLKEAINNDDTKTMQNLFENNPQFKDKSLDTVVKEIGGETLVKYDHQKLMLEVKAIGAIINNADKTASSSLEKARIPSPRTVSYIR